MRIDSRAFKIPVESSTYQEDSKFVTAQIKQILAIMFTCSNLMAGESIGLPYLKKSL